MKNEQKVDYKYQKLENKEYDIVKINNPNPSQKYDYLFRICMVGDAAVGKTSLLIRYCDGTFKSIYSNTIGVDFRIISLKSDDKNIKLNVSDTAGQERFKSVSSKYFRSAHGFFFVYDVSDLNTFKNIKNWLSTTKDYNDKQVVNFLVGNKCDKDERQVDYDTALQFAQENNMGFFETSAKDNKNVDEAFGYITQQLVHFYSKNEKIYNELSTGDMYKAQKGEEIAFDKKHTKKTGCCK